MSQYDKYKRNPKAKKFYASKEWKRMRDYVFKRDNMLCQMCYEKDIVTPGDVVHHIVELLDGHKGWELRLTASNLTTLCHSCHNEIHKQKHSALRNDVAFDKDGNLIYIGE